MAYAAVDLQGYMAALGRLQLLRNHDPKVGEAMMIHFPVTHLLLSCPDLIAGSSGLS